MRGRRRALRHVGNEVVEQAALSEQGVDAAFDGACSQEPVHAEAFAGGAQKGQQQDREGVEEQEAVAAPGIVDPECAHAHAEAQILAVSEAGLDGPAFRVELDDLRRGERAVAGGQMPRLLHARRLHAYDRADLLAGGRDFGVAQFARLSSLADPIGGQSHFAVGRADVDVAAKADDVSKASLSRNSNSLTSPKPRSARIVAVTPSGSSAFRRDRHRSSKSLRWSFNSSLWTVSQSSGVSLPWRVTRCSASVD